MTGYIAQMGDTWDLLSLAFYGNEKHVLPLMLANPAYSDTVVFEGGEVLAVPEIETETPATLPPWRR
jgi:hypothetical protein